MGKLSGWLLHSVFERCGNLFKAVPYADSLSAMSEIEGTLLFNGVTFYLDKKKNVCKVELVNNGKAVYELGAGGITKEGVVNLTLDEGIMRITLSSP